MNIRSDCSPKNKKKYGNLQKKLEFYCQELRQKANKHEKLLKSKLECLKIMYIHQYPIFDLKLQYIVDFYLPEHNLILEVDGFVHSTFFQKMKDKNRDIFLKRKGYKIIRIKNEELLYIDNKKLFDKIHDFK